MSRRATGSSTSRHCAQRRCRFSGVTLASSLAYATSSDPSLLFGVPAGAYVDRWEKRRVLVITNAARCVAVAGYIVFGSTLALLYAVSFVMTTALELYGTGLGIWTWSPVLPVLMLPAGNPPTGIGAGYAAMDALTRRIIARIERGRAPRRLAEPVTIRPGT